jgi:hypothetical protein
MVSDTQLPDFVEMIGDRLRQLGHTE